MTFVILKEQEEKPKAGEEGVSLKSSKIPDLNKPYDENEKDNDAADENHQICPWCGQAKHPIDIFVNVHTNKKMAI